MPPIQNFKNKLADYLKDTFAYVAGSVLLALSIDIFTAPNNIAPGGVSGASTLINYLTQWPIGSTALILNVPIFIWAFAELSFEGVFRSLIATVLSSTAIDILAVFVQPYETNVLLAAIFGGVLQGIALGLVFMRSATTGGTDLIARLLGRHVRFMSVGRLMMMVDGVVVIVSAFVYKSIDNAMYAIITIFVSSKIIDTILYGTDIGTGKVLFIISPKNEEIAQEILNSIDRGATMLESRGAYSGREGEVLLCAVRRFEVAKVKDIVHSIDKSAFIIVGDAGDITGEGFRPPKEEKSSGLSKILKSAKKQ
jgi:uncharacterized membrane-anchored protein YitT (DUF2179 family)